MIQWNTVEEMVRETIEEKDEGRIEEERKKSGGRRSI